MIKLLYSARRKDGIERSEFSEHWNYPHAPMGVRHPLLHRYVQYHALDYDPLAGVRPTSIGREYDGVAGAWYRTREQMDAYNNDPDIVRDMGDMQFFMNHARCVGHLVEELSVIEPTGRAPIVVFQWLVRNAAWTRGDFQDSWREDATSGSLAALLADAEGREFLQGFQQNLTLPEQDAGVGELDDLGSSEESWDGIGVFYCNSIATAKALAAGEAGSRLVTMLDASYCDPARSLVMVMRRLAQKTPEASIR